MVIFTFFYTVVLFKFSTISKNYLHSGKKYIIEQKEGKNAVPNLQSNNDSSSIFFSRTHGGPVCI